MSCFFTKCKKKISEAIPEFSERKNERKKNSEILKLLEEKNVNVRKILGSLKMSGKMQVEK